ncbi:hypothetical protein CR513_38277, partial [Mucuna pruriens]
MDPSSTTIAMSQACTSSIERNTNAAPCTTALSWYVSLERGHVRTWKDLAEAFLKQYRYNEEMASDHSRLQNMTKKGPKGFKE